MESASQGNQSLAEQQLLAGNQGPENSPPWTQPPKACVYTWNHLCASVLNARNTSRGFPTWMYSKVPLVLNSHTNYFDKTDTKGPGRVCWTINSWSTDQDGSAPYSSLTPCTNPSTGTFLQCSIGRKSTAQGPGTMQGGFCFLLLSTGLSGNNSH